jgi:hypothetical protein
VFVAWGIAGFGIGLAYLSMNELAMQATRTDQEGATGMALTIADSLGFAAGTGITGIVLYYAPRSGGLLTGQALGDGYALAWSINLLVALLTGLLAASRLRQPNQPSSGRG